MHTPEWLSEPAEVLLEKWSKPEPEQPDPYDVVIVGSGYGGSVAAARLSACNGSDGRPLTVCVLERGREHVPGAFPDNVSQLPGHVRFSRFDDPVPGGVQDGLFDVRVGQDVGVLVANGLGGGSLINAGVAEPAEADVFAEGWPRTIQEEVADGRFREHYDCARRMLGAIPAEADALAKHQQFLRSTRDFDPQPAVITVSNANHRNDHGVQEFECQQCGDCATGCNVGAKKTLLTSYLADAWRHEAEIYTGITVSHLVKHGNFHWEVVVTLTVPSRPLEKNPRRSIRAKHVILAAGTLGSTEILMRSKELSRLRLSDRLGAQFSTNGDMISAIYKRGERVNASAREFVERTQRRVGPTITGIARAGTTRNDRVVIEELAIPGSLRRVFEEIVTTTAMLERLGRIDDSNHAPFSKNDPEAHRGVIPRGIDSAAIDPDVIDGCQLFASMGNDGAQGCLQLVQRWDDAAVARQVHNGAIRIHWPRAGEQNVFKRQHQVFQSLATDGWTYLPSPLWQPFPTKLSSALSGAKPAGLLVSVHPLGGCPMADDAAHGVVDDIGRVFDGIAGDKTHDGLLVLDGSIIPTALGINPLLTITALAERAIVKYIGLRRWQAKKAFEREIEETPILELPLPEEPATSIQFSERMTGELRLPGDHKPRSAELMIDFDRVPNLAEFLQQPTHPLTFTGTLSFPRNPGDTNPPQAQVHGSVELLVRGARSKWRRILKALWTFIRTRLPADIFGGRGTLKLEDLSDTLEGLWAVASNVGEVRYMFYEFTLQSGVDGLLPGAMFTGRKTLEYTKGGNVWRQLVDLDLQVRMEESSPPIEVGRLRADLAFLFQRFASSLQVVRMRDLPAAWLDVASLGLFFARIILKIHFWSFRLPKYQRYDPMRDVRRLPNALDGLHMERHVVGTDEQPDNTEFLLLTRYRRDEAARGRPVLLIHGLGSGGIQFATGRVSPNLVQHLAGCDFDVWVAELRTSIALPSSVHQWTLDEIARGDIPRLVDFVLEQTGERQIDVVAHCIGSAMFCTAVLDGQLTYGSGESKIRRAALLQVGPLMTLSKGTRLRALALTPLSRVMPAGFVDFSVDDRADWVQSTIDRILNTYPYPPDEAMYHGLGFFDNPHIANCNRWAGIDGLMFRHENLSDEMLEHLGEILGHSNTTTWAQPILSGLLERLTDSDGRNAYVTNDNVRNHFRFPVRFLHGSDNDVFLPLTSYKSCELLKRVHGEDFPVSVTILENYRHLDPLIGRDAARDVFGHISDFLNEPLVVPERDSDARATDYYLRRPLIGPLIGWLRPADAERPQDAWHARIWCRLDDQRSPVSSAVVLVRKHGHDQLRVIAPTAANQGDKKEDKKNAAIELLLPGPMDTLLCVDVTLDAGPGAYTISVLSAHEAAQVSEEYRQAEGDAGLHPSDEAPHLRLGAGETLATKLSVPGALDEYFAQRRRQIRHGADDDKVNQATVQVPESPESSSLTFAVGSCRYPGWLIDRRRADAAFGELRERLEPADGRPSALFLIGDQIYADATAGIFDPKSRRERFYEAYREAWTAPNAREVLSRLPVFMMMDDHEAGDDWHPDDVLSEENRRLRDAGLEAFTRYQWLHSPGFRPDGARDGARAAGAFWYTCDLQGFPVFVCDTRSGRSGRRCILDERQFVALTGWLCDAQARDDANGIYRPKIVVSPSVIVPFRKPLNADGTARCPKRLDSWDGFPEQLQSLFSFIARHRINDVVFLCGDSHLSMCTDIGFFDSKGGELVDEKTSRPLRACCIMASPMYGPYPFVNPTEKEFEHDACLDLPNLGAMQYTVRERMPESGFTMVTLARRDDGRWSVCAELVPAPFGSPRPTRSIELMADAMPT